MKLIESQNFQEAANLEEGEKKRSGNEIKEIIGRWVWSNYIKYILSMNTV